MTATTETDDPRIGTDDVDTWRAVPHPGNPAGNRYGAWCVVAGDYADEGEPDVLIKVDVAEYPKDVAEFIVEAVRNEHERQTGFQRAKDAVTPRRPSEDLKAAAASLLSAAEFLDGAVGTPPSGYPLTRVLELARAINGDSARGENR